MKHYFIKRLSIAGLVLFTIPTALFAQKEKEKVEKEKSDVQQIIITKKGKENEKTVIEIDGDKVKVNGKPVESLNGDITVRLNRVRDIQALRGMRAPAPGQWNMNFDDNAISLFNEDSNRAMLGVMTDADEKGAKITSLSKGTAADKAGLKPEDIITKIDDKKMEDAEDVSEAIRGHKPGDKVTITYLRDGKEQKTTAELGNWKGVRVMSLDKNRFEIPEGFPPVPPNTPMTFEFHGNGMNWGGQPKMGLSIQDTEDGKGVKVMDVQEESAAEKAGIKENDIITQINDKDVNSADEVTKMIRENREKGSVMMKVQRGNKTQNIEVRIPRKLKTADL